MFILKKDGVYLAGYIPSAIEEFDRKGDLSRFYTGIWSEHIRDALPIESATFAKHYAEMIGATCQWVETEETVRNHRQ